MRAWGPGEPGIDAFGLCLPAAGFALLYAVELSAAQGFPDRFGVNSGELGCLLGAEPTVVDNGGGGIRRQCRGGEPFEAGDEFPVGSLEFFAEDQAEGVFDVHAMSLAPNGLLAGELLVAFEEDRQTLLVGAERFLGTECAIDDAV